MAQIAIAAAVVVGGAVASSVLTPKQKLQKVDRGRLDDLRFQTVEEGAFVPLLYGKRARVAGNVFWDTPTQEHITSTPGRSGGKGAPRAAEAPTDNYTYTKSFAILISDALPGGADGRLLKVWEDTEVILNFSGAEGINGFREAEAAGNILANGGVRVADPQCSGGMKVSLPVSSAGCQFNSIDGPAEVDVTLYYISSTSSTLQVVINNVLVTTLSLPSTSGAVGTKDFTVTFSALSSYLRFQAASQPIFIDRINLRVSGEDLPDDTIIPTGALDPDGTYPADLDNPHPFYNVAPIVDAGTGEQAGTLTSGGQSNFEFYTGTEEQGQSPIIVAVDGADNTPAYRGSCYFVGDTYQVKNGRLGNFSFEVDPGMSDLADVMTDLYKQVSKYRLPAKLTDADLDMSALAGLTVESLVIDSADGLAAAISDLSLWYNFDVIPQGSQIVAVPRGGNSEVTIPEAKLAAYEEGQERPLGSVAVAYAPAVDAPGLCNVSFIDPSPGKDFHTSTVPAQISNSLSVDPEDLNFHLGGNAEQAVAVGRRFLQQKQLERRPFEFTTGPEFSHLLPTSVVTLELSNATHVLRLISAQAALTGLCKFRAIPEKASIYTQARSPFYGTGHEQPPVEFPANSFLWLGDLPPLRLEDDRLIKYVAACKRGNGGWRGYRVYKEELSGQYDRILTGDRPAMIGVVVGVLPSVTDPSVFDRTSSLVVDFYYDSDTLASHTEAELLSRPVNVLAVGQGQNIEILQFATATASATSDPFVIRYTFTTLLRARNNTEYALTEHFDGEPCIVFDDTVHAVTEDVSEIGTERNYKAVTIGQALVDAPVYEDFLFTGNSLRPPAPVSITGTYSIDHDLLIEWMRRSRIAPGLRPNSGVPLGEEEEIYNVEIYDGEALKRTIPVSPNIAQAAVLTSATGSGIEQNNLTSPTPLNAYRTAYSLQSIVRGGAFVEATLAITSLGYTGRCAIALARISEPLDQLATPDYEISLEEEAGIRIYERGVEVYNDPSLDENDGHRFRILLSGTEVRFYRDYTGPGSRPFYVSNQLAAYPYRAWALAKARSKVSYVVLGGLGIPKTIYSAAQQIVDFGSEQSSVKVRIYQLSGVVGRGRYAEKVL